MWTPEALLDYGIRPWEMDRFIPREWDALVAEHARRLTENTDG